MDFQKFQRHLEAHPSARTRLDYGSYVSFRHRLLYIETPKVACTSLKTFLHELEELPRIQAFRGSRESKLSMFIHDREQFALPSLLQLDRDLQQSVLTDRDWFRFALVRNPYSRLLSAWISKIRTVEPGFEEVARVIRPSFPEGPLPTFSEFVEFVCVHEDLTVCDAHWCLQADLLMPELLTTVRIFPVERFGEFAESLADHLQRVGHTRRVTLPQLNKSPASSLRHQYNSTLADRVFETFRRDFEVFGYARESWNTKRPQSTGAPDDDIAALHAFYEREIFERNRLISALYSRLNLP